MSRRPLLVPALAAVLAGVLGLALGGCGDEAPTTTVVSAGVDSPEPCPPPGGDGTAMIDWVDFVRVHGRMYSRTGEPASTVEAGDVGNVDSRVTCRIADVVGNPGYDARDGDASYLPAGTELHRFGSADPHLRLAAHVDGDWLVYEVQEVEGARTGADLLDLRAGVTSVDLLDGDTGTQVLATVDDPEQLRQVVDAVLAAPVQASPSDDLESPVFVSFHLTDGTSVHRPWFRASGVLGRQLQAPPELTAAFAGA